MKHQHRQQIGEVAECLGISVDTLRYYEKIGLVPAVARNAAGVRVYSKGDVGRLRFIRRAQAMNFSLAEIGALLEVRAERRRAKRRARELAVAKLTEIDARMESLRVLRRELASMVTACEDAGRGRCPIIERMDA